MADVTGANDYYQDYFNKGGSYTMSNIGVTSRVYTLLQWLNNVMPGGKVLDVGCGDMALSRLSPKLNWTGMDINTDKACGDAVKHDIMSAPYPFADSSFDAVVCSEVLEHVWDMRVVHQEAHRLLKPGGYYMISTPNFDWIDNHLEGYRRIMYNPINPWTMEHIRHYNVATHVHFLNEASFNVLDYTGADAQHGEFFKDTTCLLKGLLVRDLKRDEYRDDYRVDAVLGDMFRHQSHTICLLGQKQ